MTDDEPWWAPIRKALVSKVADIIEKMPIQDVQRVLDAEFEDLPAKASRKRRKALPARPAPPEPSGPADEQK